jgi:formylglycine-generating enzyme required for sulfatase activity
MKKLMSGCLLVLSTLLVFNACSKQKDDESSTTTTSNSSSSSSSSSSDSTTTSKVDSSAISNQTFTANGVSFTMIGVQGGTYFMGAQNTSSTGTNYDVNAHSQESPVHKVTLSSYSIGQTEVTQALWYAVMGYKPTTGNMQWSSSFGLGDNYPAYYLSYANIQSFITKLNKLTGKTFRMPTEAEWEYAARGGKQSKKYIYPGSNTVGDVAWDEDNSTAKSHPIKTKAANELGIYDMGGNMAEWCSDWYSSTYYTSKAQTNPTGPTTGTIRVLRGGDWTDEAIDCRVSYRGVYYVGDGSGYNTGLRLVL